MTVSVALTPQTEERIKAKVASGAYGSAEEVIEEALTILDEYESLQRLRAMLQVGIDRLNKGEGIPWTPDLLNQIDREVDERIRLANQPLPDVCD